MNRFVPLVILAALSICPAANAQKSPTLEQFLSAPFPTELTAAPSKGRVAWVFNANGVRNLWVAEPAADGSYKSRQITAYKDDDGQDLGMLSWAPDGGNDCLHAWRRSRICQRHISQSAKFAARRRAEYLGRFVERRRSEKTRRRAFAGRFAEGRQRLRSSSRTQVWIAKLDGSEKAEQLIHSNGGTSELRWSPDGSKLAFASRRGDHGFIGVYDVAAKSLIYLDPRRGHRFPSRVVARQPQNRLRSHRRCEGQDCHSAQIAKGNRGRFESPTLQRAKRRKFGALTQAAAAFSTKLLRRTS